MNEFVATSNLPAIFAGKVARPTITLWNRLEGRPRTHDFDRALRAEVRDALWMLTKQWQMGEFRGDDAGSPVTAKLHVDTTQLTKYKTAYDPAEAFDGEVPLEANVERRPVRLTLAGTKMAVDIRLAVGRRWLRLIAGIEPGIEEKFRAALAFDMPDPDDPADAGSAADRATWQHLSALAGRAVDGGVLLMHLLDAPGNHAQDLVTLDNAASTAPVEAAETELLGTYRRLFYQPVNGAGTAWLPERLEYAFAASAPQNGAEKHFVAEGYHHGHLDWYNLDVEPGSGGLGPVADSPAPAQVQAQHIASFIPTSIQFDGMPHTRWWRFEEGRTNFGDIDPDTTDINKLLLIEFGLVYANDWFLLPMTLPAGTIAEIRGMTVTNVFGETTWVRHAGAGSDEDWQRWAMYRLSTRGDAEVPADRSLVLLPSVPKIQEGPPLEVVQMIRDEMANMVWGVETRVPLPLGEGRLGSKAARDTRAYHSRIIRATIPTEPAALPLENEAAIRYLLQSDVPENWTPFISVHVEGSTREVQLRRAAMLRMFEDDPADPVPIQPRTEILRHGLDFDTPQGYDIHEEEVPRAGIRVTQSFQRSRWYGGEVFLWLGMRKETGRGEGSSRLAFDRIPRKRK